MFQCQCTIKADYHTKIEGTLLVLGSGAEQQCRYLDAAVISHT